MTTFSDALHRRAARSGAGPLITFYDEHTAERTELSATSFTNWVDKTANLLLEEFELEPGAVVGLPLLAAHPGHWVSLVWVAACWQVRAGVRPGGDAGGDTGAAEPVAFEQVAFEQVALEVVGPEDAQQAAVPLPRLACSLHPLGLGFSTTLPAGVIDYAAEVRAQPDVFLGEPTDAGDRAWVEDDRILTQREITAEPPTSGRGLVVPVAAWSTVRDALVRPVLGGGSAVVVVGADDARLDHLAATERATR